jgi:zinc protease
MNKLSSLVLVVFVACAGSPGARLTSRSPSKSASPAPAAVRTDPLGTKPDVAAPPAYSPPVPTVFSSNGLTVWLLERHALPYVALSLALPSGSASDPKSSAGLAFATADMLDEGAGSRGAIELSRAIDALGAQLTTSATVDASTVSLSVLKKNFAPALALLADVVARPRFDPVEWKRVHELWLNDLKARASEPSDVSHVVALAALFGPDHPYGHPVDGVLASARAISLSDIKTFYRTEYRPDRAILVVVGDMTRDELEPLLTRELSSWKAPAAPVPPPVAPPSPTGPWPRVVLVDRPDAPQSVIALVRPGVAATDPAASLLTRANLALGGMFTSRLNQDLREARGYSYGASSRVSFTRSVGQFVATAAVFTDKTVDALKALEFDVNDYASKGMTDEEVDKTRLHARAELVEAFESADHAAARLSLDAALGLAPDYERTASLRREAANKTVLNKLAQDYLDPSRAIAVVVGPRATVEAPLVSAGFSPVELRDPEGKVIKR